MTKSDIYESMRNLDSGPKIINMISSGIEKVIFKRLLVIRLETLEKKLANFDIFLSPERPVSNLRL